MIAAQIQPLQGGKILNACQAMNVFIVEVGTLQGSDVLWCKAALWSAQPFPHHALQIGVGEQGEVENHAFL